MGLAGAVLGGAGVAGGTEGAVRVGVLDGARLPRVPSARRTTRFNMRFSLSCFKCTTQWRRMKGQRRRLASLQSVNFSRTHCASRRCIAFITYAQAISVPCAV